MKTITLYTKKEEKKGVFGDISSDYEHPLAEKTELDASGITLSQEEVDEFVQALDEAVPEPVLNGATYNGTNNVDLTINGETFTITQDDLMELGRVFNIQSDIELSEASDEVRELMREDVMRRARALRRANMQDNTPF